jgi:hypothetical protein
MRGKAVPQRVQRHSLLDAGDSGRSVDGAIELAGRERLGRIAAGKQPAPRQQHPQAPALAPPGAHRARAAAAIAWHGGPPLSRGQALAALALLDSQQHALGVDIASLERDDFRDAQPSAICSGEPRLVLWRCAARSSSVTSSTLSTAGIRRGYGTTVSRRARSDRSSVTVKKKRRAETALLMLGGCMPICIWCSWKRRRSSAVAVSGDRPIKAANARTWRT